MADTRMAREEREAFLTDLHVGVLSIPRSVGPPLTVDYVKSDLGG
jgi:hypothetical protein